MPRFSLEICIVRHERFGPGQKGGRHVQSSLHTPPPLMHRDHRHYIQKIAGLPIYTVCWWIRFFNWIEEVPRFFFLQDLSLHSRFPTNIIQLYTVRTQFNFSLSLSRTGFISWEELTSCNEEYFLQTSTTARESYEWVILVIFIVIYFSNFILHYLHPTVY
jgi:hypothetical protein